MNRSLRILYISSIGSQAALTRLYEQIPQLRSFSYAEQLARIVKERIHFSDYLPRALRKLGHECVEIIHDAIILQNRWREEFLAANKIVNNSTEMLCAQIANIQPELVYFQDACPIPSEVLTQLRDICPTIKLFVIHQHEPCSTKNLEPFDLRFVSTPGLQYELHAQGMDTLLLRYAFDPVLLQEHSTMCIAVKRDQSSSKDMFGFAGYSGFGNPLYSARYWTLASLLRCEYLCAHVDERLAPGEAQESALRRFYSKWMGEACRDDLQYILGVESLIMKNGKKIKNSELLKNHAVLKNQTLGLAELEVVPSSSPMLPLREMFPDRTAEPEFGLPLFEYYLTTDVNLNVHPRGRYPYVGSKRLFEITGIGGCLLTDGADGLADLFLPGEELMTYKTISQAKDIAVRLLTEEKLRKELGARGQRRTLSSHTWDHRAMQINDQINSALGSRITGLHVEVGGSETLSGSPSTPPAPNSVTNALFGGKLV